MKDRYKFILALTVVGMLLSCSKIKEKFSESGGEKEGTKEEVKEKMSENSGKNLEFYNKYIDVSNKLSEAVDNGQKYYLQDVPEPTTITKSSMIFAISSDVYLTTLERTLKDYKRSYFDGGELSKLKPDNDEMKEQVEAAFKEYLAAIESYYGTARKVIDYYKNKEYQDDLSKAVPYDKEMKTAYETYSTAEAKFSSSLKKYKPQRNRKDPNDYSNPNEKAVIILQNTYENVLENSEEFFNKFESVNKNSDVTEMQETLMKLKTTFEEDTKTVQSAEFTDQTKYMKYSFEDYFSKTFNEFVKVTEKFLNDIKAKKMDDAEYTRKYDEVVRDYNNLINAYNSSITTLNSYRTY